MQSFLRGMAGLTSKCPLTGGVHYRFDRTFKTLSITAATKTMIFLING